MNKNLRPSWVLPGLTALTILSITFTGCGGGPVDPPVNVDSVKTHAISIKAAAELTANFRSGIDSLDKKCPGLKDSLQFGYSEAFNRDTYQILLNQKDSTGQPAAGIRVYYGRGKTGQIQLVLVPYDRFGNDILHHLVALDEKPTPGASSAKTESLTVDGAQAMEEGQHCPPTCPPTSPLGPTKP